MSMGKDISRLVTKMIRPILNRLSMIVARGVLELVRDTKGIQAVKLDLLAEENRDNVERFQQYGFTSNPLAGAECVVLFQGGNREHGLVVSVDDRRFRLKNLQSGEVALYTDEGDMIHFKRGREIRVVANTKIVVESDKIELGKASLEKIVNGEAFQELFNSHKHLGNLGVPTGVPIEQMEDDLHLSDVVSAAP